MSIHCMSNCDILVTQNLRNSFEMPKTSKCQILVVKKIPVTTQIPDLYQKNVENFPQKGRNGSTKIKTC